MSEIQLRGVRVHNLKSIDLDIPYEKLVVLCGVSGSGKSSLAIDTLYAEGQRRYIESFSAYTRQFLEKLEKPDADQIEGILPAAAVTAKTQNHFSRSTIGTATETVDYLRLLFSKIGKLYCRKCGREVRRDSPESILQYLEDWQRRSLLPLVASQPTSSVPTDSENASENLGNRQHSSGVPLKIIIAFEPPRDNFRQSLAEFQAECREAGFLRGIVNGRSFRLDEAGIAPEEYESLRQRLGLTEEKPPEPEREKDLFSDADFFDLDSETEENGDAELLAEPPAIVEDEETEDDAALDDSKAVSVFVSSDGLAEVGCCTSCETPTPGDDQPLGPPPLLFFVDRLVLGKSEPQRIRDSLETALQFGAERLFVLLETGSDRSTDGPNAELNSNARDSGTDRPSIEIDGQPWDLIGFSRMLSCEDCGIEYPRLEPKLFSFNSPYGACPVCEGFGNLVTFDLDLIVPNKARTIREGAIAPWNTPSYKSKLNELLSRSEELGIPVDVPFEQLNLAQRKTLLYGSEKDKEKDKYEGLSQFFEKLQKQKYKMHIRVFLSRWRSYKTCPACEGTRLRPEALAVRVGIREPADRPSNGNSSQSTSNPGLSGCNIAEICAMPISESLARFENHPWDGWETEVGHTAIAQTRNRLRYLQEVGLGYLTLERTMRTLSGGEQRRIGLTSALGSSLVNMLYVLDEPSIGLHPCDTDRLMSSILGLRDRGNTVVVVEHEEAILKGADRIVEIGPEAGSGGGSVVFEGTLQEILESKTSLTGSYLSGKRSGGGHSKRRTTEHGFLELFGASGHNLKNIDVTFPMGILCLITGVSGAGKSSLIQETLYPALCRKLGKESVPPGLPYTQILGTGQIDDVVMVDQSSIGRSPRSNPVTYLKIFDEIRTVFAETLEAKTKNFGAGHFSFNVDGGRCDTCKGDGMIAIDMQFMADMYLKCPQCQGKRYKRDVLEIMYRGKNIAEVLEMTAREAFGFFRGQSKVQRKLKRLMDVGLDYIRLGQPANTLSGGESQRLKLAAYLSHVKKGRCLFLLDEPTTGLHFADIVQLLDCFDALIETGHSLIVVEHNLQMMRAADYIIDLGPGPAEEGGRVLVQGTPEAIAKCPESLTGRFLKRALQELNGTNTTAKK